MQGKEVFENDFKNFMKETYNLGKILETEKDLKDLMKETYELGKKFEKEMKIEHLAINVVAHPLANEVLDDNKKKQVLDEFKKYGFHINEITKVNPKRRAMFLVDNFLDLDKDKQRIILHELVGYSFKEILEPSPKKKIDYLDYNTIAYFGEICKEAYRRRKKEIPKHIEKQYFDWAEKTKEQVKLFVELSDPEKGPKKMYEVYEDTKRKFDCNGNLEELTHTLSITSLRERIKELGDTYLRISQDRVYKTHFLGYALADEEAREKSLKDLFNQPKEEVRKKLEKDKWILDALNEYSFLKERRYKNIEVNLTELWANPEKYKKVLDMFYKELDKLKKLSSEEKEKYISDLNKEIKRSIEEMKNILKTMKQDEENEKEIYEEKILPLEIKIRTLSKVVEVAKQKDLF